MMIVAVISNVRKAKDTAKMTTNVLEIWFVAKTIVLLHFTVIKIVA